MKKILSTLLLCMLFFVSFAQTRSQSNNLNIRAGEQTNVTDSTCFCCNGYYNLPAPKITGPVQVNCGDNPRYTIAACPGATIAWTISPTATFTGNGTNTITLTPPLSASSYAITATIRCGNKQAVSNQVVKVNTIQNCTPAFDVTVKQLPNGSVSIDAVPVTKAGVFHYWGIMYNGNYPNCNIPCVSIPFANFSNAYANGIFGVTVSASGVVTPIGQGTQKTGGSSGYGIGYAFPNNSCFKVTHYINCCGEWLKQTVCVSIGTSSLKSANPGEGGTATPSITKSEIEKVDLKDVPKELKTSKDKSIDLREN
jgi:hypothetical protein